MNYELEHCLPSSQYNKPLSLPLGLEQCWGSSAFTSTGAGGDWQYTECLVAQLCNSKVGGSN